MTLAAKVGPWGLLLFIVPTPHILGGHTWEQMGFFSSLEWEQNKRNARESWGQEGREKLDLKEYFCDGGQALGGREWDAFYNSAHWGLGGRQKPRRGGRLRDRAGEPEGCRAERLSGALNQGLSQVYLGSSQSSLS